VHETHVSVVFLVGDRALKLKRAVEYPFLDLSTPARREWACRREVELNRRLAPDVYLGVAEIVGPDGAVCDHVVVMRRMPDERRMSTLVTAGAVRDDDLTALARLLAAFHARAETSPTIAAAGTCAAVRHRWEAGFAEIAPFVGTLVDPTAEEEIEARARRYLDGRGPLFAARVAQGRVVDGHGDLLAGDVFLLDDGPRVLDCLEFDDELRYGDVLADVAFLAMDLERLGAPEHAARFLADYRRLAGETHPVSLEHHYVAFRAHIRAKVACLGDDPNRAEAARTLMELACAHLRRAQVVLVLLGGGPGTGKSTVAAGLAARQGWTVLRSDEVRKDLAGIAHTERVTAAVGTGIYDDASTAATYATLLARARTLLEHGESVILDATWGDAARREQARAMAREVAADVVELRCDAPAPVVAERVALRTRAGDDVSDATVDVARAVTADADPWPTAVVVDTAGARDAAVDAAARAVEPPATP
jgi:aminoglycoside phosphotransferase family enzyme/predicted kinase